MELDLLQIFDDNFVCVFFMQISVSVDCGNCYHLHPKISEGLSAWDSASESISRDQSLREQVEWNFRTIPEKLKHAKEWIIEHILIVIG